MQQHPIFVGGSRNGTAVEQMDRRSFTFVDGYLVEPSPDGTLTVPINATIELYVLDRVEKADGEPVSAYFLAALDDKQRREKISLLTAA